MAILKNLISTKILLLLFLLTTISNSYSSIKKFEYLGKKYMIEKEENDYVRVQFVRIKGNNTPIFDYYNHTIGTIPHKTMVQFLEQEDNKVLIRIPNNDEGYIEAWVNITKLYKKGNNIRFYYSEPLQLIEDIVEKRPAWIMNDETEMFSLPRMSSSILQKLNINHPVFIQFENKDFYAVKIKDSHSGNKYIEGFIRKENLTEDVAQVQQQEVDIVQKNLNKATMDEDSKLISELEKKLKDLEKTSHRIPSKDFKEGIYSYTKSLTEKRSQEVRTTRELEEQLDILQTHQNNVADLNIKKDELLAQKEKFENLVSDLNLSKNKKLDIAHKINNRKNELKEIKTELKSQNLICQQEKNQYQNLQNKLGILKKQLRDYGNKNKNILRTKQKKIKKLKHIISKNDKNLKEIKKQLETHQKQLQNYEHKKLLAIKKRSKEEKNLLDLQKKHDIQKVKKLNISKKIKEKYQTIAIQKDSLQDVSLRLQTSLKNIQKIQSDIKAKKKQILQKKNQINKKEKLISQYKKEYSTLSQIKNEVQNKKKLILKLTQQEKKLNSELKTNKQKLYEQKKQLSLKNNTLANHKVEYATLKDQHNKSLAQKKQLVMENRKNKAKSNKINRNIQIEEKKLDTYKKQLLTLHNMLKDKIKLRDDLNKIKLKEKNKKHTTSNNNTAEVEAKKLLIKEKIRKLKLNKQKKQKDLKQKRTGYTTNSWNRTYSNIQKMVAEKKITISMIHKRIKSSNKNFRGSFILKFNLNRNGDVRKVRVVNDKWTDKALGYQMKQQIEKKVRRWKFPKDNKEDSKKDIISVSKEYVLD